MKKATMILSKEWDFKLKCINEVGLLEGWNIFHAEDEWRLEKLDDEMIFECDEAAYNFVYHKFLEGYAFHSLAIEFLIEHTSDKEIAFLYQSII